MDDSDTTGHRHHLLAERPWNLSRHDWRDVIGRVWSERSSDDVSTRAAAVAYSAMFSIPPLLIAVVSLYGIVSSPADVRALVERASTVLPPEANALIEGQLQSITAQSANSLSIAVVLGVLGAILSVSGGVNRLSGTINEIYDEKDTRPWYVKRAWSFLASALLIVALLVSTMLITLIPSLVDWLDIEGALRSVALTGRWVLLLALMLGTLGSLYRFGPKRSAPTLTWLSVGTTTAALAWLVMSAGFSFYVQNFARYGSTYGSLGSVIVFLTWLYLTAYIVLLAGELNAELERQTLVDTTAGGDQPIGDRGAVVADEPAENVADEHPELVSQALDQPG